MPEHGDGPGFIESYSVEDARAVFDEIPNGVVTAADVANALGCSRDSARRKLKELVLTGEIKRREPSERSVLWYLPGATEPDGESDGGVLGDHDPDAVLKQLSREVNDAITVGDTMYEDGDKHPVSGGGDDTAAT